MLRGFSFLLRTGRCGETLDFLLSMGLCLEKSHVRSGRPVNFQAFAVIRTVVAVILLLSAVGCGVSFAPLPAGSVAGRAGRYDYSPAVIQSGNLLQLWWCGTDDNSSDRTQMSDSIQYESFNLSTGAHSGPVPVLAETQYAWDSAYTCNPKVVGGSFANPLGNGKTYSYAMYYVATASLNGENNSIGVAFSNDGLNWKKYPQPIIPPETQGNYGVGQPAVYNTDHNAAIRMFYEDYNSSCHHVEAISSDGVHFTTVGTLTTNGLDPNNPQPSWGDMAFDPETGYWYAAFNLPVRNPSTTGGVVEPGQYGIQLYRIPDGSLLSGTTPWQMLTNIDTSLTGYESNFIAGFLRDSYGSLNIGSYPTITLYTSISNPPPPWNATPLQAGTMGGIDNWDISTAGWVPGQPLRALNQYFNQTAHEVTTGWIDPKGGFSLQSTLGHLYQSPQQGATIPFYGCKSGSTDYFVSLDFNCGGSRILGNNGYGYAKPVAGLNLVALYRCSTGPDDFVSHESGCGGQAAGQLLGYALP
jgi:hypothetical protein